jgi:hypothetical protein
LRTATALQSHLAKTQLNSRAILRTITALQSHLAALQGHLDSTPGFGQPFSLLHGSHVLIQETNLYKEQKKIHHFHLSRIDKINQNRMKLSPRYFAECAIFISKKQSQQKFHHGK